MHAREETVGAVLDRILTMRGRDRGAFIPGARKYAGQMKAILNAAGLAGLESQGAGFAYDAVTRDKLWPRYDAEEQRAAGDTAGAAYLKTKIRSYVAARPDDSPKARADYRAAVADLRERLDTAHTLSDVLKVRLQHYRYPSAAGRVIGFEPPQAYMAAARAYFAEPEDAGMPGRKGPRDYELRRDYARVTHGPTAEATLERLYGDKYTIVVSVGLGYGHPEQRAAQAVTKILGPRADAFLRNQTTDAQETDIRTAEQYDVGTNWTWASAKGGAEDTTAKIARETLLPPTDAQTLRDAGWSAGGAYVIHKVAARFPATVAADAVAKMQPALDLFRGIVTGDPVPDALSLVNTLWATFNNTHRVFFGIATPAQEREQREAIQHGMSPTEFYSDLYGAAVGGLSSGWGRQKIIFGKEPPNPEEAALFRTAIAALPEDFRIGICAVTPRGNRWLNALYQDAFRLDGRGEAGWTWAETTAPKARSERFKFERPAAVDTVRKGGRPIPATITSERVERDFALQGTQYGKWMNDSESDRIEASMYGSLLDLADILGVPDRAVSFGGRLAFAFGARGMGAFAAHYEPRLKVINMTRTKGAGAVAHEWGHAFDHWLGDDGKQGRDAYVSVRGQPAVHGGPAVQAAIDALLDAMHGADPKVLEKAYYAADTAYRDAWRRAPSSIDAAASPVVQAARAVLDKAAERWRAARREGGKPSNYTTNSKKAGEYYARPWEMFARAFEAFAEDTLADAGRISTYFVNGTRSAGLASVYPAGEERVAINAAFRALIEAIRPALSATARV